MKLKLRVLNTLLISFLIQLTACTTIPTPDAVDDPVLEWSNRQTLLNEINFWNINGRLAVTNEAEVWHLSVKWKQQGQNYKIHLSGPFGAGAVQLIGDDSGVTIKDSEMSRFATNPEQLLYESTGVKIPIQNLFYWVRGLPNPDSVIAKQLLDPYGRLNKITQDGWSVRFKRYKKVNKLYLPTKVFIKRNSRDIRFVIEDWAFKIN